MERRLTPDFGGNLRLVACKENPQVSGKHRRKPALHALATMF